MENKDYKKVNQKNMEIKGTKVVGENIYIELKEPGYDFTGLLPKTRIRFDFKFTEELKEKIAKALESDISDVSFVDNAYLSFPGYKCFVRIADAFGDYLYSGEKVYDYKDMKKIGALLTPKSKVILSFNIVFVCKVNENPSEDEFTNNISVRYTVSRFQAKQ